VAVIADMLTNDLRGFVTILPSLGPDRDRRDDRRSTATEQVAVAHPR